MPEVQPSRAPYPNAVVGWTGAIWHCLSVDAAGQLQIDVVDAAGLQNALVSVGLDHLWVMADVAGIAVAVATRDEQIMQTTALELIDDLVDALQSVNTDRLQVRGEDQLFSYREQLDEYLLDTISGADGYVRIGPVLAGEVWCVRTVVANDVTSPTTGWNIQMFTGAVWRRWYSETVAIPAGQYVAWGGEGYVDAGGFVDVFFPGSLVGDQCRLHVCGFKMTLEV